MIVVQDPQPLIDGPSLEQEALVRESAAFALVEEDLEVMRFDVVALITLLRSLSLAIAVRSVESFLREEDAGPQVPPMSEDDWKSYV